MGGTEQISTKLPSLSRISFLGSYKPDVVGLYEQLGQFHRVMYT